MSRGAFFSFLITRGQVLLDSMARPLLSHILVNDLILKLNSAGRMILAAEKQLVTQETTWRSRILRRIQILISVGDAVEYCRI